MMDIHEDVALQSAIALSLQPSGGSSEDTADVIGMQDASAASLKDGLSDAEKPTCSVAHGLPHFVAIQAIHPDGWCFYDGVLKHLRVSAGDGEVGHPVLNAAMVAALCLSCLAHSKENMQAFVADEEGVLEERRLGDQSVRTYGGHLGALEDFDVYVLDKLEACLRPQARARHAALGRCI